MQDRNIEISVVVPAYNESSVIGSTIQDIRSFLKKKFRSFEIIVVDDGSTDSTRSEVARYTDVTLLVNERNRGKGFTVNKGVLASRGDLILYMDADNSTNIRELDHMLEEIKTCDMVIGSRATLSADVRVSQNWFKKIFGRLGNLMIKLILGMPFQDTQCGFKLMKSPIKQVFEKQTIDRWGFDFEILFVASKMGFSIKESGVTWINNFDSKVKTVDYGKVLFELIRVRFNFIRGAYSL